MVNIKCHVKWFNTNVDNIIHIPWLQSTTVIHTITIG